MIWIYVAIGAAAAASQAVLLRRSARLGGTPFGGLLRLLLVGSALTLGAVGGHLLATAVAWAITFLALSSAMVWRWS